MTINKITAAFTLLTLTLGAGGTVVTDYGNGVILPKSDDVITWSAYGSPLTLELRDQLALATASVDVETTGFRLLHELHPELSTQHVFFSFDGSGPDPRCLDNTPGGCTLAVHECLVWERAAPYRLCSQNRIKVYTANIATGGPVEERLYNIIRHEWSHALGYEDGQGGPSNVGSQPFTPCQLKQLSDYDVDLNAGSWVVTSPPECQ